MSNLFFPSKNFYRQKFVTRSAPDGMTDCGDLTSQRCVDGETEKKQKGDLFCYLNNEQ